MEKCFLCPRNCGADRGSGRHGFCGVDNEIYVAKIMCHKWEEPCICHGEGAGTVFFSGCNLHCVYCQNSKISHGIYGDKISEDELISRIFELEHSGASCIEFVTPTHYTDRLVNILSKIKQELNVPVVWNSGGYEKAETLKALSGLVDIYMPDLKYFYADSGEKYSNAPDYFQVAISAIKEMLRQVGPPQFNCGGRMSRGVIIRHLVLPGGREESAELLRTLAEELPDEKSIILSLMSQYTPDFYIENHPDCKYKNLTRRLTSFEYNSVLNVATSLGFEGYFQQKSSADKRFTPDF